MNGYFKARAILFGVFLFSLYVGTESFAIELSKQAKVEQTINGVMQLSHRLTSTPDTWVTLDAKEFNTRTEKAVSAGVYWPQPPLMMTLYLFGDDQEAQSVIIKEMKNRGEDPDAVTIAYIRDGFLDDSIRSSWHQVDLHRQPDGTWRIIEAQVAYMCWRAENIEIFRDKLCP